MSKQQTDETKCQSNRAIKYRLYPTKDQVEFFSRTFGCCRKVWNLMLADKIAYYKLTKKILQTTPAMYKNDYPFLKEVDSLALANVQLHLQTAYKNFFRDKKIGFPKFKSSKHSKKSYTTNNNTGKTAIVVSDDRIKLPKIGVIKAKIHRVPDETWIVKSATISMESDGSCYASVLFAYTKDVKTIPVSNNAIGLDYKSDGLYMDSNGKIGTNHKYYRESQKRLAKEQRKLSRMKGSRKNEAKSNNWYKQKAKVNKMHRHIANQRLDNLHKISTEIANQYDVVCVEDLNMKTMSNKDFGNGKATLDNGYGIFVSMLEYKLADRGKYLSTVDKWYPSSQICYCCGKLHPEMKELKTRKMICSCGNNCDRDYNAALNIRREGLRLLGKAVA